MIEDIECVEGIASDRCLMGWGRSCVDIESSQQKREQWSRAPTELRNDTGGQRDTTARGRSSDRETQQRQTAYQKARSPQRIACCI